MIRTWSSDAVLSALLGRLVFHIRKPGFQLNPCSQFQLPANADRVALGGARVTGFLSPMSETLIAAALQASPVPGPRAAGL